VNSFFRGAVPATAIWPDLRGQQRRNRESPDVHEVSAKNSAVALCGIVGQSINCESGRIDR
jgi:hypothetical protein